MASDNAARKVVYEAEAVEVLEDQDFHYLRSAIWRVAGITLSDSKKELVRSRLRSRVIELGLGGISDYRSHLQHLPSDHPEWQEFTNCLTTNKTDWFREPAHFEFLVNQFMPRWKGLTRKRPLRIWSAACSTGEEPYTLAMILNDVIGKNRTGSYDILATDIDTEVLAKAQRGIYPASALSQVPEQYHKPAFIAGTEGIEHLMKVQHSLKQNVTFRQCNLTQTPYPWSGEFDVIFCRNVFIYFSKDVIAAVLDAFYRVAASDAILFIGHSESLQGISKWRYIGPSIYAKGNLL